MRAWQIGQLGDPEEVLRLVDVAEPVPGPDQAMIDIEAVGLKFADILQIQGRYQVKPSLPFIPGSEIAGTVADVGSDVDRWKCGDRVLWMGNGGLAPRVCAPADQLLPIPDAMPATEAAAMLINYGTGVFALEERAKLQPGETVLVTAAAGGVGSAAIQLAKAMGATVFGLAGGPDKVATAEAMGADKCVDYRQVDIVEAVRELTDGRGVDVVYEAVGGDVFDQVRRVVAWDGRLLVIGFASGRIPEAPANHILLKNYAIMGVHWGAMLARDAGALRRHWDSIVRLYQTGHVDPLIYAVRPLEKALESLQAIGSRKTVGKIIIEPSK